MGNCAGCAGGPERRNKDYMKELKREKSSRNELKYKAMEKPEGKPRINETELVRSMIGLTKTKQKQKSREKSFSDFTDSQKKILSRTVQKYHKPTTIKQEEQGSKENMLSSIAMPKKGMRPSTIKEQEEGENIFSSILMKKKEMKPPQYREQQESKENLFSGIMVMPKKTIHEDSLEKSIEERKNKYEEEHRERNILFQSPSEIKEVFASSTVSAFEVQHSPQYENNSYFKTKKEQRDLDIIMEMFKEEAQTPGYIRGMKKDYGEDIRMDNFGSFEAVPQLESFNPQEYLNQII